MEESHTIGESWATLHVISKDRDVKAHREKICERVRDYFEKHFQIAAQPRVVCFFDDQDHEQFKQEMGGDAVRGAFVPTKQGGFHRWPDYTRNIITQTEKRTGDLVWPPEWTFNSVIYLHGSTCVTDIGLTLTFAHELQHFLQYVQKKPLWAANQLLKDLHPDEFKNGWDLPHEIEARHTGKLVAESIYGIAPVNTYMLERIEAHITDNDADDWTFVQTKIDTSIPYRLADATKPLVQRYRRQLEAALQRHTGDEDFANVDFDA